MQLTRAQLYVLGNAAEGGGCWLWELGASSETHLEDRILRWERLAPGSAQEAAIALVRDGLAVVRVEPVDANARYTGEIWTVEEDEGIAALSNAVNWAEPWTLQSSRPAAFSLATTQAGEVALEADGYPEPDEVRVRP